MRLLLSVLSSLGTVSANQDTNGLSILDLRSKETKLRDASREKREVSMDNPLPMQDRYPK